MGEVSGAERRGQRAVSTAEVRHDWWEKSAALREEGREQSAQKKTISSQLRRSRRRAMRRCFGSRRECAPEPVPDLLRAANQKTAA